MIRMISHIPYLLHEYRAISKFEDWPQEKTRHYQVMALARIVESAKKIPFYRDLYREAGVFDLKIRSLDDLKHLPVIDKALCREKGYEDYFLHRDIPGSVVTPTSGSTGNPFQIRIPGKQEVLSPLKVIHAMKQYGWKPWDKGLEIWVGETKPHKRFMRSIGLLKSISIFEPPAVIREIIEKHRPDYIFSNPTTLEVLADHLKKINFRYQPKFLMSSAGEVREYQRRKLEDFFRTRLLDVYGCLESPTMAYSCPEQQQFHVFQTTSIAEVINPRNIEGIACGDLVVTNLSNDLMPFVRYLTGDVVRLTNEKCGCHRHSQIIGEIMGRSDEIIRLGDGRAFNYLHFWMKFKKPLLIDHIDKIEQYKIWFFKKQEDILFQFRLNDKISLEEGRDIIEKIMKEQFSDIKCRYEIVDNITLSESGKFKIIEVVEN